MSAGFVEHLLECLAVVGPVQSRHMFGGHGIYADQVMFGLVADDVLYLKVDKETSPLFEAEGLTPFVYKGKTKPIAMSYYQAPDIVFDEPDEMKQWAGLAISAAKRASAKKKPRTKQKRAAKPST